MQEGSPRVFVLNARIGRHEIIVLPNCVLPEEVAPLESRLLQSIAAALAEGRCSTHTSISGKSRGATMNGCRPNFPALYADFGPEDLAPLMKESGVTHTVLVQAAETEHETDYLLGIAEKTDFILGVVGWLDMLAEDFGDRLDHYRGKPKWVGLRPMLPRRPASLIC